MMNISMSTSQLSRSSSVTFTSDDSSDDNIEDSKQSICLSGPFVQHNADVRCSDFLEREKSLSKCEFPYNNLHRYTDKNTYNTTLEETVIFDNEDINSRCISIEEDNQQISCCEISLPVCQHEKSIKVGEIFDLLCSPTYKAKSKNNNKLHQFRALPNCLNSVSTSTKVYVENLDSINDAECVLEPDELNNDTHCSQSPLYDEIDHISPIPFNSSLDILFSKSFNSDLGESPNDTEIFNRTIPLDVNSSNIDENVMNIIKKNESYRNNQTWNECRPISNSVEIPSEILTLTVSWEESNIHVVGNTDLIGSHNLKNNQARKANSFTSNGNVSEALNDTIPFNENSIDEVINKAGPLSTSPIIKQNGACDKGSFSSNSVWKENSINFDEVVNGDNASIESYTFSKNRACEKECNSINFDEVVNGDNASIESYTFSKNRACEKECFTSTSNGNGLETLDDIFWKDHSNTEKVVNMDSALTENNISRRNQACVNGSFTSQSIDTFSESLHDTIVWKDTSLNFGEFVNIDNTSTECNTFRKNQACKKGCFSSDPTSNVLKPLDDKISRKKNRVCGVNAENALLESHTLRRNGVCAKGSFISNSIGNVSQPLDNTVPYKENSINFGDDIVNFPGDTGLINNFHGVLKFYDPPLEINNLPREPLFKKTSRFIYPEPIPIDNVESSDKETDVWKSTQLQFSDISDFADNFLSNSGSEKFVEVPQNSLNTVNCILKIILSRLSKYKKKFLKENKKITRITKFINYLYQSDEMLQWLAYGFEFNSYARRYGEFHYDLAISDVCSTSYSYHLRTIKNNHLFCFFIECCSHIYCVINNNTIPDLILSKYICNPNKKLCFSRRIRYKKLRKLKHKAFKICKTDYRKFINKEKSCKVANTTNSKSYKAIDTTAIKKSATVKRSADFFPHIVEMDKNVGNEHNFVDDHSAINDSGLFRTNELDETFENYILNYVDDMKTDIEKNLNRSVVNDTEYKTVNPYTNEFTIFNYKISTSGSARESENRIEIEKESMSIKCADIFEKSSQQFDHINNNDVACTEITNIKSTPLKPATIEDMGGRDRIIQKSNFYNSPKRVNYVRDEYKINKQNFHKRLSTKQNICEKTLNNSNFIQKNNVYDTEFTTNHNSSMEANENIPHDVEKSFEEVHNKNQHLANPLKCITSQTLNVNHARKESLLTDSHFQKVKSENTKHNALHKRNEEIILTDLENKSIIKKDFTKRGVSATGGKYSSVDNNSLCNIPSIFSDMFDKPNQSLEKTSEPKSYTFHTNHSVSTDTDKLKNTSSPCSFSIISSIDELNENSGKICKPNENGFQTNQGFATASGKSLNTNSSLHNIPSIFSDIFDETNLSPGKICEPNGNGFRISQGFATANGKSLNAKIRTPNNVPSIFTDISDETNLNYGRICEPNRNRFQINQGFATARGKSLNAKISTLNNIPSIFSDMFEETDQSSEKISEPINNEFQINEEFASAGGKSPNTSTSSLRIPDIFSNNFAKPIQNCDKVCETIENGFYTNRGFSTARGESIKTNISSLRNIPDIFSDIFVETDKNVENESEPVGHRFHADNGFSSVGDKPVNCNSNTPNILSVTSDDTNQPCETKFHRTKKIESSTKKIDFNTFFRNSPDENKSEEENDSCQEKCTFTPNGDKPQNGYEKFATIHDTHLDFNQSVKDNASEDEMEKFRYSENISDIYQANGTSITVSNELHKVSRKLNNKQKQVPLMLHELDHTDIPYMPSKIYSNGLRNNVLREISFELKNETSVNKHIQIDEKKEALSCDFSLTQEISDSTVAFLKDEINNTAFSNKSGATKSINPLLEPCSPVFNSFSYKSDVFKRRKRKLVFSRDLQNSMDIATSENSQLADSETNNEESSYSYTNVSHSAKRKKSEKSDDNVLSQRQQNANVQQHYIDTKSKENCKRENGSYFIQKAFGKRTTLKETVMGRVPKAYTAKELQNFGIKSCVINVTSENASEFIFGKEFFEDGLYRNNSSGVTFGDNCLVIMNEHDEIGFTEISRAFLASLGVDPNLISLAWIQNHYKWIIWKLASMERSFPSVFGCQALTLDNILYQLKYRYNREIDNSERSCLKRIIECDDSASKMMVLCVSKIVKVPDVLEEYELELTDGWYSIMAQIDQEMNRLISLHKVVVGTKLFISNGELNMTEGCDPLKIKEDVRLKICTNSTRRVKWDTRLGFFSSKTGLIHNISSILPNGSMVTQLHAVVARVYPLLYFERLTNGKTDIHSERVEAQRALDYENKRQLCLESLTFQARSEACKELKIESDIYPDVGCNYQLLFGESQSTDSQSDKQTEFLQLVKEKIDDRLPKEFQEARNVTPLLKVRLIDEQNKSAILTLWRPSEDLIYLLHERKSYKFYNVLASGTRLKELQLSSSRKTRYECIATLCASVAERRAFKIADLLESDCSPTFGEIDFVGIVVYRNPRRPRTVYLTDVNRDVMAVTFRYEIQKSDYDDILQPGLLVVCINLQWKKGLTHWKIPNVFVSEFTTFSLSSKHSHLQTPFEEGYNFLKTEGVNEILRVCGQKIFAILNSPNPVATSTPIRSAKKMNLNKMDISLSSTPIRSSNQTDNVSLTRMPKQSKNKMDMSSKIARTRHENKMDDRPLTDTKLENKDPNSGQFAFSTRVSEKSTDFQNRILRLSSYGCPPPLSAIFIAKPKNHGK